MSNAIYKAICNKDKLYFKQLKHRTLPNISRYKTHRNKLNRIIITAKKMYYKTKLDLSANRSKAMWSVINEILSKKKKKSSVKRIKKLDGQYTSNKAEIAETFNNYFSNIGTQLASSIPDKPHTIFLLELVILFSYLMRPLMK